MMQDLNEPIPEPPHQQPKLNQVNLLLRWLCCFILYWQVVTHSEVEWLLTFLGRFLQTLNYGLNSDFFSNLMLFFPTTIYMLQKLQIWRGMNLKNLLSVLSVQNCTIWMNALRESMKLFSQGSALTFCCLLEKQSTVEISWGIKSFSRMVSLNFINWKFTVGRAS